VSKGQCLHPDTQGHVEFDAIEGETQFRDEINRYLTRGGRVKKYPMVVEYFGLEEEECPAWTPFEYNEKYL